MEKNQENILLNGWNFSKGKKDQNISSLKKSKIYFTFRRDLPVYGLGYFMMRPDECQFQCPELDACINATVWCDGIEDCPSGVDESITNCSVLFQLSPLSLLFGACGVLLSR